MPEAPDFWWHKRHIAAWALAPVGLIYGALAGARMGRAGASVELPVICIGNFVMGGAGKTPVALAVAEACRRIGRKPAFLTRGYGGLERGPLLVQEKNQTAVRVGDEPLLLARSAPTVVAADRMAGARLIAEMGNDIIIMDDGFQNPSIRKDLSLVVVDGGSGVGNGWPFPAGPLRAPLATQLRAADAVIRLGEGEPGQAVVRRAARAAVPVLTAIYEPVRKRGFKTRKFLAFAGIGRPQKFYDTLERAGVKVELTVDFPDHHTFTEDDCRTLVDLAESRDLVPVTTEKDWVRIRPLGDASEALLEITEQFPVVVRFGEEGRLDKLITEMLSRRAIGGRRGKGRP
jgi:tetraacyldisaccharide 4'-kinase